MTWPWVTHMRDAASDPPVHQRPRVVYDAGQERLETAYRALLPPPEGPGDDHFQLG